MHPVNQLVFGFLYKTLMSRKYKIRDQEKLYFVTFTVIDWIDIFIRDEYRNIIIESIQYCQDESGHGAAILMRPSRPLNDNLALDRTITLR